MKIAIGTNDRKTINSTHFGESRYFCVFEILMAQAHTVECRDNPWAAHEIPGKARNIVRLLNDCDAIVIRQIGKEGFKAWPEKKRLIFRTTLNDLDDIVGHFSQGEMEHFKKYNAAAGKFQACAA
jgi:predicted Fe-Mo cluster-binding NifX family protein